ncbi:MAG: 50S ribosomal protein L28 [Myxococcota bacterium]
MRRCQLTGKKALVGYNISHSHRRTKKRQQPNLQTKRIWDDEKKRWLRLKVSTSALRTLDKIGLKAFLQKYKVQL